MLGEQSMKKIISLVLIVLVSLCLLSGCSKEIRFTGDQKYITVTNTYIDEEISIRYPQVKGLGDNSKERKINELIKNDILDSTIGSVNPNKTKRDLLDLTMDFDIKMDTPEILSVLYSGYSTYYTGDPDIRNWSSHGYRFHSITINMITGEKLELSDFVNIDLELINKVKASENVTNRIVESHILSRSGDLKKIAEYRQQLLQVIQSDNDEDLLNELTDRSDITFCVTSDSLIIKFNSDIAHAAGYYALVEISK